MTSSEFAARYRLLKNVASRGARSFLAQQVELGRMVMVHYLDAESADEQARTLARLDTLRGAGRDKLLEIADVDGTHVAVTLFISSFVDFATWLDNVSDAPPPPAPEVVSPVPGEFTRAFNKAQASAEASPRPVAARREEPAPVVAAPPPPKTPGEFTRIFGKVDTPSTPETEPVAEDATDAPTLIMEAVKPPAKPATSPIAAKASASLPEQKPGPAAPAPTVDSSSGFTAIFGRVADAPPATSDFSLSAASPLGSSLTSGERVMPPALPIPDFNPPSPPPASIPQSSEQPGEFTQLFQRLSPSGGTPLASTTPPSFLPPPSLAPERPRSLEATPRADIAPPAPVLPPVPSLTPPVSSPSFGLPAPSLGSSVPPEVSSPGLSLGVPALPVPSLGGLGTPVSPSGPRLPDVPAMANAPTSSSAPPLPPPAVPAWNGAALPNVGSLFNGGAGQSEFTRILGRVPAAPPPPVSIQPPNGAPSAPEKPAKSMMPLIVALNAVVLLTIAIVAYFIIRR